MSLKYIVKCKYFGNNKTFYKDFISEREYNNYKNWLNNTRGYTNIQFLRKHTETLEAVDVKKKISLKNKREDLKHYLLNNKKPIAFNKFVYCLIHNSDIVYVGKSNNVQERILLHHKEGVKEFNSFAIIAKLSSETTDAEVLKIEENHIKLFKPKYNIVHNVNNKVIFNKI